jgi:hypothetical protein
MSQKSGMGSHHSHAMGKDEWLTPPDILAALGEFDLDPCAPVIRPWDMAVEHYTIMEDGLSKEWSGRVWCNPPYGRLAGEWLEKLAGHGNGIALIFARTETVMFVEQVWGKADALLFIHGRLHFHHVCGTRAKANSGAPSVLIAYGKRNADLLETCDIKGSFVRLIQ